MKKIAVGDLGEFWYGDYKEPFEQLEGAVPGHPVGVVLKAEDGKLLCSKCGKSYENLASHVSWTHGMTARSYKEEVGLLQKSALVSDRLRITHARTAMRDGLGTRPENQRRRLRTAGDGVAMGEANGRRKAEHLNKTGTCYKQALEVGRTVVRETGRLSERTLRKHGIFATTIARYFGDMDGYRQAVGLQPVRFHRWSEAELSAAIRNLAMDLGRTPTASDARRYGLPTSKVYRRAFGTWAAACERAGLVPNVPLPNDGDTDALVLATYATLGAINRTAQHLHMDRARVEAIFARFGAPFVDTIPGRGKDSRARREWAAEMARRITGTAEVAA